MKTYEHTNSLAKQSVSYMLARSMPVAVEVGSSEAGAALAEVRVSGAVGRGQLQVGI